MDSSVEDPDTLGIVADLECPSPPTRNESLPADGVAAGDRSRLHQPLRPPDPSRSARVRRILTHISHINPVWLVAISNGTTQCSRIAEHSGYHEC